jgi:hypothetical protein
MPEPRQHVPLDVFTNVAKQIARFLTSIRCMDDCDRCNVLGCVATSLILLQKDPVGCAEDFCEYLRKEVRKGLPTC